ncbi:MAG: type I-B CRISPR-associated protein Cas7/Cst2/DevR [Clostridia bacterium]|nr:type I-B CRISPR-associated protein Cas7/Cst2/DevR [Clostridia bacterium]
MNKKGITLTIIFKAQSLNYGEGIGNISELKKLSRGDGSVYTYASRQALRYDIARLGNKMFNWNLEVVDKLKGTIQFKDDLTIEDSEEMDLFGYMKTAKKEEGESKTRSAAVRLSNAISLEDYKSDMEFLTNKGLADRINEFPNIANVEQHLSFYTYTITIDLEKIGEDGNIKLSNDEKVKRVIELLEVIKILNREIRGREENLSPLFIIGGIYEINSPFFLGRIKLDAKEGQYGINTDILKDTATLKLGDKEILKDTYVGLVKNEFANEEEVQAIFNSVNIQEFFEKLENEVKEYYK